VSNDDPTPARRRDESRDPALIGSGSSRKAVNPASESGFRHEPHLATNLDASPEHDEGGNSLDPVPPRGRRMVVAVELQHEDATGSAPCRSVENGGCHATRPAPGSPKVDENRHRRRFQRLLEVTFGHFLRSPRGIERMLAPSADWAVRQAPFRNAIQAPAPSAPIRMHFAQCAHVFRWVNRDERRQRPRAAPRLDRGAPRSAHTRAFDAITRVAVPRVVSSRVELDPSA
jgi:hypothetical protein